MRKCLKLNIHRHILEFICKQFEINVYNNKCICWQYTRIIQMCLYTLFRIEWNDYECLFNKVLIYKAVSKWH